MNVLLLATGSDTGGQGIAIRRAFEGLAGEWTARSATVSVNYLGYEPDLVSPVDKREIIAAYEQADIVHVRNSFKALRMAAAWPRPRKPLILHHHGTQFRQNSGLVLHEAARFRAPVYVSTFDLLCQAPTRVGWIPAPIDIDGLARLRTDRQSRDATGRPLRIMHAPTVRAAKGTDVFLRAVEPFVRRGLLEVVLVERRSWRECVTAKAAVDLFFDQVTHGIGNNALEAFAMGIPVLSGAEDPRVMDTFTGMLGELPFYPATRADLAIRLGDLIEAAELRTQVADAGRRYVERFHAPHLVARRLEQIYTDRLEGHMGKPRCPICGTEEWKCGQDGHTPVAVDRPFNRPAPVGGPDLVKVEIRPGVVMKLTPEEAAHYGAGPLAPAGAKKREARNKKRPVAANKQSAFDPVSVGAADEPALD